MNNIYGQSLLLLKIWTKNYYPKFQKLVDTKIKPYIFPPKNSPNVWTILQGKITKCPPSEEAMSKIQIGYKILFYETKFNVKLDIIFRIKIIL